MSSKGTGLSHACIQAKFGLQGRPSSDDPLGGFPGMWCSLLHALKRLDCDTSLLLQMGIKLYQPSGARIKLMWVTVRPRLVFEGEKQQWSLTGKAQHVFGIQGVCLGISAWNYSWDLKPSLAKCSPLCLHFRSEYEHWCAWNRWTEYDTGRQLGKTGPFKVVWKCGLSLENSSPALSEHVKPRG